MAEIVALAFFVSVGGKLESASVAFCCLCTVVPMPLFSWLVSWTLQWVGIFVLVERNPFTNLCAATLPGHQNGFRWPQESRGSQGPYRLPQECHLFLIPPFDVTLEVEA